LYAQFWRRKLLGKDAHKDKEDIQDVSHLLLGTPQIEFPENMCPAVAEITDGFSFAYIQEAFVAALLALAQRNEGHIDVEIHGGFIMVERSTEAQGDTEMLETPSGHKSDDGLEDLVLWKELKKQIKILRDQLDEDK
jgi:hypothetical protein